MLIKNNWLEMNMYEEQIHRLILYSGSSENGLLHGKFGISICFFHLSRHLNNDTLNRYANILLDEIWTSLSNDTSIDFESGLSGVGWGIEYLIQNNFVKGNSNLICNDIDSMIMRVCPLRFSDYSLESGLEGILYYICARISGARKNGKPNPFLKSFIDEFKDLQNNAEILKLSNRINLSLDLIKNKTKLNDFTLDLNQFIDLDINSSFENLHLKPLGLKDGISGLLLQQII